MLPDLSNNVNLFGQNLTVTNMTQVVVDHIPQWFGVPKTIVACVQIASPESLKINNVDFSLKYLYVHALPGTELKINDTCVYYNKNYKCINLDFDSDYDYIECLFEEVKNTTVVNS